MELFKICPGLVGGHCIGVDPYYLTYKAKELGHNPKVILSGRQINDEMGAFIAKKTVQLMIEFGKDISRSKVLIMGVTFKENVSDIRNSKVADMVDELISFSLEVEIIDPLASSEEVKEVYGLTLAKKIGKDYDAIIVAVNHKEYSDLNESYFQSITNNNAVIVGVKGNYRNKIKHLTYWSL